MMLDRKVMLFDNTNGDRAGYLQELLELQAEYESKYVVKVEAPKIEGKHDDYSDALCRMIWIAAQSATNKAVLFGNRTGAILNPSRFPSGNLTAFQRARQSGSHESRMIPRLSNRPRWR